VKPAFREIEIPYEHLHKNVRTEIDKLVSMRNFRIFPTATSAATTGIAIPVIANMNIPEITTILLATGGLAGHAIGSAPVARQTEAVGKAINLHGLIEEEKKNQFPGLADTSKLREKHPFAYVTWNKNIVLLQNDRWERIAQMSPLSRKRTRY